MFIEAKTIIQNELLNNEDVIWHGAPYLAKHFIKFDIFFIPFSVFWLILLIHMLSGILINITDFHPIGIILLIPVSVAFMIFGLYFVFGRFIMKRSIKKRTIYAITNKRILVIRMSLNGAIKKVSSREINSISDESVSCDNNGIGTISFGAIPIWSANLYTDINMGTLTDSDNNGIIVFYDIEDCMHVFNMYKDVKYQ